MTHLHVTGCRRSGTTLLFELLTTCFEHGEHCEHEQSIYDAPVTNASEIYLSKKPTDITHIQNIFFRDEHLYLFYIRRDPRSVITSIHPTRGDTYYASFERWLRYEKAAAIFKDHPRYFEINYEDLVKDPDRVQDAIESKFSFLKRKHRFTEFHEHAKSSKKAEISLKGIRPVSAAQLDGWREHLPRIRFQLDQYPQLAQTVIDYGYESDDAWLKPLQDIKPRSQRYGEALPNWFKRRETDLRYWLKGRRFLKSKGI